MFFSAYVPATRGFFNIGESLGNNQLIYYSGEVELTIGQTIIPLHIPTSFWLTPGIIVAASIIIAGLITEPEVGWTILSIIIGGFIMVLGYFIY